jgi:transcriptional regulator with XRE-family HTH domain
LAQDAGRERLALDPFSFSTTKPMYATVQTIDLATAETLVPPGRLGALLFGRRQASGLTLDAVADHSGGIFTADELALVESGTIMLADDDITRVTTLYGVDLRELSPHRAMLEIDRTEGRVQIGESAKRFHPADDDREIMASYLALVYRVRGMEPGQILPARVGDLTVLAAVFGTSPDEVHRALDDLMLNSVGHLRTRHTLLRRRVIVPAIGALIAVTAIGGLLLTQHPAHQSVPTHIGTALVIDRSADVQTPAGGSIGPNIGDALSITR